MVSTKHFAYIVAILSVLIIALCLFKVASSQDRPPGRQEDGASYVDNGLPHGLIDDGVTAFLFSLSGKRQLRVGEPIQLVYGLCYLPVLKKGTSNTIRVVPPVLACDPGNRSWFRVTGPDGKEVPYRGVNVTHGPIDMTAEYTSPLSWGRIIGGSTQDFAQSFDVAKPGEYKITWHYSMPPDWRGAKIAGTKLWSGRITSNQLSIEIVE